jgi:hypothetical protein
MEVTDRPVVIDMRVAKEANVWPMIPAGGTIAGMIIRPPEAHEEALEFDKANIPG